MKKLFNKVSLYGLQFTEDEIEIRHKFTFLNNVYFFAIIIAFFMGFIRWKLSPLLAMLDFGFAGISLALLYYLRYHKEKLELLSLIALILASILFFSIYLLAPYNTTRLSLFFLLSASAFYLKGRKTGFLWTLFILSSIILGHFFYHLKTAYSNIDIFTTCVYLIALFFIFDNYEVIKEEQQEYLEHLNRCLEQEVQDRTKELEYTNRALEIEKQAFKNLSFTDQLTGLYNRYKFQILFEYEKEQTIRHKTELSFMMIDLDLFKLINDQYGHLVGDSVLKQFALILKDKVRKSDSVVRWGGEEFIIMAPKTSLIQASKLAEILRKHVSNSSFSSGVHLTASFGVTSFKNTDTLEQIIQRVDKALYLAKTSGRDNVKTLED